MILLFSSFKINNFPVNNLDTECTKNSIMHQHNTILPDLLMAHHVGQALHYRYTAESLHL